MKRRLVSDALRQAALLPLALAACGGSVESGGAGGPAASGASSGMSGGSSGGSSGVTSGVGSGGMSGASSSGSSGATSGVGSSGMSGGSSGGSSGATSGAGSSGMSGGGCTLASQTPTATSICSKNYALAGDIGTCNPGPGGSLSSSQCQSLCPSATTSTVSYCSVSTTPPTLTCYGFCATGRRPEGLGARETSNAGDGVARYLAEMAWLEAASVPAFERLTRELEAHGAPRRLRDRSRRAASDEVRHARRVGAFATAAGGVVRAPQVGPLGVRPLEEIAIENAVEGCVRETFGAAVAAVQAARAGDVRFRAVMKRIARDEARHARLSWEVSSWLDGQLDDAARSRVAEARGRAADELLRETSSIEPDAASARALGLPTSREALAMVGSLRSSLWS